MGLALIVGGIGLVPLTLAVSLYGKVRFSACMGLAWRSNLMAA